VSLNPFACIWPTKIEASLSTDKFFAGRKRLDPSIAVCTFACLIFVNDTYFFVFAKLEITWRAIDLFERG